MLRFTYHFSALALIASATLVSCLPIEQADSLESKSLAQSSQGGLGVDQSLSASEWSLPEVVYPEQENVRIERHVGILNTTGRMVWQQEDFRSDGQGEFRVDLTGVAVDYPVDFATATDIQIGVFDRRQRYLVRFRDLHFGDALRVRQNYTWREELGVVTVAGTLCDRYYATSRFEFGSVEYLIASDSRLLMGWTLRDKEGLVTMTSKTISVEWSPDHSNIVWSIPASPTQSYTGSASDIAILGFEPTAARYVPAGFSTADEQIVLIETVFPDIPNLHLDVLNDGLRTLFFAQQRNVTRGGGPGQSGGTTGQLSGALYSELGGIRALEGLFEGREIYIVAPLPTDELMTMLGSLFD